MVKIRGLLICVTLIMLTLGVTVYNSQEEVIYDEQYRPETELNAGDKIITKVSEDYAINLTDDQVVFISRGIKRYNGIGVYDTVSDEVVKYVDSIEEIAPQLDEYSHQITQVTIDSQVYKVTDDGLRLVSPEVDMIYYSEQGDLYRKNNSLFYNGVEIEKFGEKHGQISDSGMIRQTGDYIFYQTNCGYGNSTAGSQKVSAYNIESKEKTKLDIDFSYVNYFDGKYYISDDYSGLKVLDESGATEEMIGAISNNKACSINGQAVINDELYTTQFCMVNEPGESDIDRVARFFKLNEDKITWDQIVFDSPPTSGDTPYFVEEGIVTKNGGEGGTDWKYFALDTMEENSGTSYMSSLGGGYSSDANAVIINKNGNEISTFTSIAI